MAARILRAATGAIAEKGFNGTNIRDIGARGGMSSGSLYNHFGSKADILATIALRGMIALVTASQSAKAEAGSDPRAQLDALVAMHVGIHAAHPRESAIGNAELHNLDADSYAEVVAYRDRQEELFTSTIEQGVSQGVFATDIPREASALHHRRLHGDRTLVPTGRAHRHRHDDRSLSAACAQHRR